jgi:hypothetical protein
VAAPSPRQIVLSAVRKTPRGVGELHLISHTPLTSGQVGAALSALLDEGRIQFDGKKYRPA